MLVSSVVPNDEELEYGERLSISRIFSRLVVQKYSPKKIFVRLKNLFVLFNDFVNVKFFKMNREELAKIGLTMGVTEDTVFFPQGCYNLGYNLKTKDKPSSKRSYKT